MDKIKYDGNQIVSWDKCDWKPKETIEPKRAMKLSEAIRECGYATGLSVDECVLARAYRRATGNRLADDCGPSRTGNRGFIRRAAEQFGVPYDIADEAESRCMEYESKEQIADWLEGRGY